VPRRSDGEGSVYQRSDGRWVGSLRVGGIRRSVYGKTRREAAEKLHALKNQAMLGPISQPSKLTAAAYLEDWLEGARSNLRPTTAYLYEHLVRLHIVPVIGHVRLKELAPLHLSETYRRIRTNGRRARTAEQVHRLLHKALADAVKLRVLSTNPASCVEVPAAKPAERTLWTTEQVTAFVSSCAEYRSLYDPLWLFLLGSGCRIGEALGLKETDVDWDSAVVSISRAVVRVGGRMEEGAPKTRAGVRKIVLPQFTMDALAHRRQFSVEGYLFRNGNAAVTMGADLRRRFHEACRRADVSPLRIHELRKMHATLAIASGVDVKTVQRRLGHATLALTLAVYAQAMPCGDAVAAQSLDRMLSPRSNQSPSGVNEAGSK
jgi:integrase